MYYFLQLSEKAKKWPNGQTILFLANSFKKGQMATLVNFIESNLPSLFAFLSLLLAITCYALFQCCCFLAARSKREPNTPLSCAFDLPHSSYCLESAGQGAMPTLTAVAATKAMSCAVFLISDWRKRTINTIGEGKEHTNLDQSKQSKTKEACLQVKVFSTMIDQTDQLDQ